VTTQAERKTEDGEFRRILGIRFFVGDVQQAIHLMGAGGLLVVPAAPALKNLPQDHDYREALLGADVAITDSALMVLVWNFTQTDHIPRLSGLKYLAELLTRADVRRPGASFWVMPGPESAITNLTWLRQRGVELMPEDIYVAPMYGAVIRDEMLLEHLRKRRPGHVIITLGGGTQERLGLYLKRNLEPLPAIHCIGAAIAFLSGDQVRIPMWADRLYLGWLFRCVSRPRRYVPRYWAALGLIRLIFRYRDRMPAATLRSRVAAY
jgi:UDP-N-acetyl-D-mannosaminuronic acid transferase (WecB/TagA/CpsF family)